MAMKLIKKSWVFVSGRKKEERKSGLNAGGGGGYRRATCPGGYCGRMSRNASSRKTEGSKVVPLSLY